MNEFEAVAERCMAKAQEYGRDIIQLPLWADDQRGAPAVILRSALFGIIERGKRKAVENQTLAAWAGNEIRYTGFRLDQADLDCWLYVLHLARLYPLGRDVRFTAGSFLSAIGRKSDGGNAHRWLQRSLTRMVACAVCIRLSSGQEYTGPLISEFFRDEASGRYVVRVNPLLSQLFDDAFVKLSMEKRLQLGADLARWFQGYVHSQKATTVQPHRIGIGRLQELCGSVSQLREFRRATREAMAELQKQEIVTTWRLTEGDALEFIRPS